MGRPAKATAGVKSRIGPFQTRGSRIVTLGALLLEADPAFKLASLKGRWPLACGILEEVSTIADSNATTDFSEHCSWNMLAKILWVRHFEERAGQSCQQAKIVDLRHGCIHPDVVALVAAFDGDDSIITSCRNDGHANVGVGIALAPVIGHRQETPRRIIFFGDRLLSQSHSCASMNLAAIRKLPFMAIGENDRYPIGIQIVRGLDQKIFSNVHKMCQPVWIGAHNKQIHVCTALEKGNLS